MKCVIQRVRRASVTVGAELVSEIGPGLLILGAVEKGDTEQLMRDAAKKIRELRIFSDDAGKMNLSVLDRGYEVIVVSQFTLYGDIRKGRRPSFIGAAAPDEASPLIDRVLAELRALGLRVGTGQFGAEMAVSLVNDGPVTIWIDTAELRG